MSEQPNLSVPDPGDMVEPLSEHEAKQLDMRIRLLKTSIGDQLDKLLQLVEEARQGQIHIALGFPSWTAYIADALRWEPKNAFERRQVVQLLSAEGMSQRAIAPIVGVSKKTVQNDQAALQVDTNYPPPPVDLDADHTQLSDKPPEVKTGLDGKTYPAKHEAKPKPKPPNTFCRRFYDHLSDAQHYLCELDILSKKPEFSQNIDQLCRDHGEGIVWAYELLEKLLARMHTDQTELFPAPPTSPVEGQ